MADLRWGFLFLFPDLVVNLGDGSFPAATLRQLIDRAFAISLELVQVFVEDLAGAQSWNQVVKLPADFFRGAALFGPSFPLPLILKLVRNRIQSYWKKKILTVITASGVFSASVSHHRLHPGPPLLLILASLHVLEVLSCVGERLQEGVEDPEKLIRLHSPFFLPKVLQRFGKLHKAHIPSLINNFKHIETKCVIIQAGHEHMSLLFKFIYCHSCWKLTHTHTHTRVRNDCMIWPPYVHPVLFKLFGALRQDKACGQTRSTFPHWALCCSTTDHYTHTHTHRPSHSPKTQQDTICTAQRPWFEADTSNTSDQFCKIMCDRLFVEKFGFHKA